MKKVRLVLLGAGSRSRAYTENILSLEGVELAGVVEPNAGRRNRIVQMFDLPAAMAFESEDAFFEGGRREGVDGLLICTMDRDHARQAIRACRCGYDLLLEKPAALTREDCLGILEAAAESGSRVMVCHVLRYTPFFGGVKKILDSGELGRIIAVQHNENACVFHFAHSYVRGSWRNSAVASPIILAKSCHDLDILSWLVGERCLRVSSYGGLSHFRRENAPKGSAERCCDCPVRKECLFDAEHIYLDGLWWNKGAVNLLDQSDEGIRRALRDGPYGRCVYRCDNDVCDHQAVIMEFESGATASFILSAFTNDCSRTIKVMCEKGEIRGNMKEIEVHPFGGAPRLLQMGQAGMDGHGGGDRRLLEDFIHLLRGEESQCLTSLEQSLQSHFMAFAAEESRLERRQVELKGWTSPVFGR